MRCSKNSDSICPTRVLCSSYGQHPRSRQRLPRTLQDLRRAARRHRELRPLVVQYALHFIVEVIMPIERTFHPWVGSLYSSEGIHGKRLLILGESHYGGLNNEYPEFTINVIQDMALDKGRLPFFSRIQRLVVGGRGSFSTAQRHDFWQRVAFYNYIQSALSGGPRCRPTPDQWRVASTPFLQTIAELAPHYMLVLGLELFRHLPPLPCGISACPVQHPSAFGFKYSDWQHRVLASFSDINA